MKFLLKIRFLTLGSCIFLVACQQEEVPDVHGTYFQIQTKILDTSCAIGGCHASVNDDSFREHNLVLAADVSYANLVNVAPQNNDAKADGLMLVKPSDSEKSLLYHKLLAAGHHPHSYGNPMPLGLPLLTVGQVEYVRAWIEAGAPAQGAVADPLLLNDEILQPENYEPLAPPPADLGFQVNLGPFTVAPNFEREFFVYKKLGNTEDVYLNRIEIKMRQNSHHFILYDFNEGIGFFRPQPDVVRDIRNPDGTPNVGNMIPMAYHLFVSGTQTPYFDYQLPSGVAIPVKAGTALDLNSHYVNKSTKEIPGEVQVNFYTVPATSVQKIAKSLNLANTNLSIPAKQRVTLTKNFMFDQKVSILSLTSHTHQLGEKFIIKIKGGARNGEIVYTSTDWHHPLYLNVNPPIVLNAGEGLTSEITYNNTTDVAVKFGLTSKDEMGIIFGYYVEE